MQPKHGQQENSHSPQESRPSEMPSRHIHNKSCAMSTRYGQLWNMDMAYVQTMPYIRGLGTATCRLCSLEDSSSHLLGGCRHQDMVKSYIERHNEAGRLILQAIAMGSSGYNLFIAPLCTTQNMQARGGSDRYLPFRLAQKTTSLGLLQAEKKGTGQMTHSVHCTRGPA